MSDRIMIVDDEVTICEMLKLDLELEGFICDCALTGDEALVKFREFKPDLVLLDLMLPGLSGYEVCREIHSASNIPVIMLTAKSETEDKITGLETGADDYMTKPFSTRELIARIKALLRRYKNINKPEKKEYKNGPLVLFPDSQAAYINNRQIKLTVTEFEILNLFISHKNRVFSRESLARELGVDNFQTDTRAIDMHIQRLRKKLAVYSDIKCIETVFGIGYKMRDFDEHEV